MQPIKGLVHPKILLSFTHHHPNP